VKTPVLHKAGENAVFGPPSAPDEGVLSMMLHPNEQQIIVRVMDYEWGQRDAVLGEVLLDINRYADGKIQEVGLTYNGAPTTSVLTFEMSWESNPNFLEHSAGCKAIRVKILRATGLRQAAVIYGQNNVYVQAYSVGPAIGNNGAAIPLLLATAGTALPVPLESVTLPAGNYSMPFSFKLPPDLPSSFSQKDCYISYSVYSNIDIAWALDPSARRFFSVVQPHAVATMMKQSRRQYTWTIYPQICIPPCFWLNLPLVCCPSLGGLKLITTTERYGYAPGDTINCSLDFETNWTTFRSRIASVEMRLQMVFDKQANGHTKTTRITVSKVARPTINLDDSMGDAANSKIVGHITVPVLPPSYHGGLACDTNWIKTVNKWGNRWTRVVKDAVIWRYVIEVKIEVRVPGRDRVTIACNHMIIVHT
jgi:hypothetical protein